jgi:beta-phosphoglucomutase-like phosphatase (HAD superfamily)
MVFHKCNLGSDIGPEKFLVFEDAPAGVEAAVAASMKAVLVQEMAVPKEPKFHQRLRNLFQFASE